MSKLVRCNRCKTEEEELERQEKSDHVVMAMAKALANIGRFKGWRKVVVGTWPRPGSSTYSNAYDLCEDCTEVLVEQFLKGAAVAPITTPLVQTVLPHEPMTDCMLIWDPERGGFVCEHDDSERYHKLVRDQLQNAAEGVPPEGVEAFRARRWHRTQAQAQARAWVSGETEGGYSASDNVEPGTPPEGPAGASSAKSKKGEGTELGMVIQKGCGLDCSEQHTYEASSGCIMPPLTPVKAEPETCKFCMHPSHFPGPCEPGCFCRVPEWPRCGRCGCVEHNGKACSSTGCDCITDAEGKEASRDDS